MRLAIQSPSRSSRAEQCALKPSFARRLRRLAHQPWLDSVTPDALRKKMAAPGLPAGVIVEDGSLMVTGQGVGVLLGLIEQMYWVGTFDQQLRQTKAYLTVTPRSRPR